jgi:hypothetical protein
VLQRRLHRGLLGRLQLTGRGDDAAWYDDALLVTDLGGRLAPA